MRQSNLDAATALNQSSLAKALSPDTLAEFVRALSMAPSANEPATMQPRVTRVKRPLAQARSSLPRAQI